MGQYYKPINLDREEFFRTWDYDCGSKLMEHSWVRSPLVSTITELMKPGGKWHQTRIVWAGDYMDNGLFMKGFVPRPNEETNLYMYAENYFTGIQPEAADYDEDYPIIVNHDKKEYVDIRDCRSNDDWTVHPLPILTSSGNGRGGGDYRPVAGESLRQKERDIINKLYSPEIDTKSEEYSQLREQLNQVAFEIETCDPNVGAWAGHHISVEKEAPGGFNKIVPDFYE